MQELIRRCGVPLALYSDRHAVFKVCTWLASIACADPIRSCDGRAWGGADLRAFSGGEGSGRTGQRHLPGSAGDRTTSGWGQNHLRGQPSPVGFLDPLQQALWGATSTVHQRISLSRSGTRTWQAYCASSIAARWPETTQSSTTGIPLQLLPSSERSTYVGAHVVVQERLDGKLVVCYQNQIVPTQEAPPRPGVLRTLNATRGLGSVTVENLAAGMDTNGIGGHEREGLGAMTAIGRGLAAGRLTTDREGEAVHPKAQPPRPPTPRQRARWKAVQRAKRRGLSLRAIARELGISRITARKYVEASSPPVYPDRELAAHS